MIALIRARFPKTPANQVWSDTVAANWMDPTIPFSLAHYWRLSTFQQVDMSHVIFPPVVLNDPRQGKSDDRDRLVRAVLDAVDKADHPNWNQFDRCIIFFAQKTELFGGGTHIAPNGKLIAAAVFDLASGFDLTCQEVGHTLGLRHELGAWYTDSYGNYTNEYGCPYSVMSAASDLSFQRAPDPGLPGVLGPTNPQRSVGPYIPTAHLYINQYHAVNPNGVFNHPDSVSYVPVTYEYSPVNVRLYARDVAIAEWPNRRTVLAVVPPIVAGGDTHFLELRRRDGAYDEGIGNASIIILAANFFVGNTAVPDPSTLRLRYVDRIDLEAAEGDLDYHSFSGRFVVRVSNSTAGFASVNLSIGGGNAWQDFRLILDDPITNRTAVRLPMTTVRASTSDWNTALVSPCPLAAKGEFKYRVNTFQTLFVLQAHSAGYEAPGYSWKVEGVPLDPAGNALSFQVSCRDNAGHLMKNYYPDRTLWTSVCADNLGIEWDGEYQAASEACWKRLRSLSNRFQEMVVPHRGPGDPDPPYFEQIGIREIIGVLAERDPQAARAVAAVVAGRAAVSIDHVLEAALRKIKRA